MTMWTTRVGCGLLVLASVSYADDAAKAKGQPVFVTSTDLKWGDAPPDLPKGVQMVVLRGDPRKPVAFTLRLKVPDGYRIPPHWHSKDEELTILSGTLLLHMGDTMTTDAHTLDAGAFHFLPGKMHHGAEFKGETVVQLSGTGPFDIHYLSAADNPNPKTAKK
jgi:hypothetical protein